MVRAWLSLSRAQSWVEKTSKSSASKVSRWARSRAVRFAGNGGLATPPPAGSGIGAQPARGAPPPGVIASGRPDRTAPSGRFRVSADTPDQVELFQRAARRVSDMLGRPVVSYANGKEIVITFGQQGAAALALRCRAGGYGSGSSLTPSTVQRSARHSSVL
jgi:hypothetical protein